MKKKNILTLNPSLSNREGHKLLQSLNPSLLVERGKGVSIQVKYITLLLLASFLAGCQKNVTLNVPQPPSQICVEGHVEPGQLAWVYLSHNFAFFDSVSVASVISNDIVKNAVVTVNDGYTTDTMQLVTPLIGYYETKKMKGITGRTYNLTV